MRDARIECYRVILMFGICALHSVAFGIRSFHPVALALTPCVDGFVLISGYFGIRFSFQKVLRLIGIGVFCAFVSALCGGLDHAILARMVSHYCGYWFLHAYIVMMCMAPIVEVVLDRNGSQDRLKIFLPFLVLVFGWGLLTELPVVHRLIPRSSGLGSFSGLTLMGVYIVGRLFRKLEMLKRIRVWWLWAGVPILLIAVCLGNGWFGHYCSPFTVLLAMLIFCAFLRLPIGNASFSRAVIFIGPSMFSVYLLHTNTVGFGLIKRSVAHLTTKGLPPLLACLLVVCALFFGCLAIDLLRRFLLATIRSFRLRIFSCLPIKVGKVNA